MWRLVSLNLNGIRSAASKGWVEWVEKSGVDCMGVQELKAQAGDLTDALRTVAGMPGHFHCAVKKGYSGVGLYTRKTPSEVITGIGVPEFDDEGRYVEARFDTPRRKLSIISCYFPSGSAGPERQASKFRFLEAFFPYLELLKATREFILVGDVNIAHREIDLKNWRSNQKNSGFLPEERAWMTRALGAEADQLGLIDVHRSLRPDDTGEAYTWWSNRGAAWANNVGWRIDYQLATPALAATARAVSVYKAQRFSDHAPLIVDYELQL
ncbi:MAG TPA: exodeoxyribonuclease III [Methylibium sp.]|uniref:exodeoxyribonuclease III n=1 Tax=Methylibium sp. TaxID=2067992 RepID=UPI002DBB4F85|nr:exodeoxyribonuclease III [Methylibium sp.]HEU4458857.1 exodeoxyribonuclease III [Methylibium sp.]